MHVVATAGHVDHGKSTLVKALTGSEPDRLAEEHRRGLSIELGYCWTRLDAAGDVVFVDVPGHERFLPTMLSGVGPVPAVLFVVAADDPWMPQAAEHLAALDALGVRHGVVAVTRCDLADPATARDRAATELSTTTLRASPLVDVSSRSGQGLDELRSRLVEMVQRLPVADAGADVRLWVDRRFSIRGAGTVVTGTLQAGRVCVDDVLRLGDCSVRVRGVQSLDQPVTCAAGVSRVALNLVGSDLTALERGSVLVSPDAWHFTDVVDVLVAPTPSAPSGRAPAPPRSPMLHIGAASVIATCRPLGGDVFRLRLPRPLPLRIGDRALLRDPGSRRLWGVTVLDPAPPKLARRGAAAARAEQLATAPPLPELAAEVERRGLVHLSLLRQIGVPTSARADDAAETDGWLMSTARAAAAGADMRRTVHEHRRQFPLDPGVPVLSLTESLGLPAAKLVKSLVQPPLTIIDGQVTESGKSPLPAQLERAIDALGNDLHDSPFAAPTADRLAELGLDGAAVAAAAKAARVLRVADGIVLMPGAERQAAERLAQLPQPFTASQARAHLATSRRVVLPLLEYLDKSRITRRLPDDRRILL